MNYMDTPARMLQNADTEKVIFQKMVTENSILLILKRKVWNGRFEYVLQIEGQTKKDSKEPLDSIMVTLPGIEPGLPG